MAFKFDGVDDVITFSTLSTSLRNLPVGNYTVAVLMARTTWGRAWDPIYTLKDTTAIGTFDPKASAEWQGGTIFTAQDTGNNRNWTHGLGTLSGVPLLVVLTKPTGAVAFQVSVLNINTSTWTHGNTTAGANAAALPSTGALTFGSFPDLFLGSLGVFAAWPGVAMTQTQRMECGTNLQTSDMANHSAGAPASLIEFTAASPTDLMGGVSSIFVNSAPVLDNTVTLGWTYDGTGAPPAGVGTFDEAGVTFDSADSQFDFFIAPSGTPITDVDSFTLSESALVDQTRQISVTDSGALSEARTLERQSSVTDSGALSEARALSVSLPAADSGVLTDSAALAISQAIAASDSATLSESPVLTTIDLKTGTDSAALSEALSIAISASVLDTMLLTEGAALSAGLSVSDAVAMAEQVALTTIDAKSSSDAATLTEAVALARGLTATDAAALAEAVALNVAAAATDAAALTEQRALSASLLVVDTETLSESIALLSFDAKTSSDSGTLSESQAVQAQQSSTDSATLSEALSISAAAVAADSIALSEARAISAAAVAADTATLAESIALLSFDAKVASDSFALSEAQSIQAQISAADAINLAEAVTLAASAVATDLATLTESAIGGQQAIKTGTDSGTLSELAAVVRTNQISVSDSAALSEALALAAQIARSDTLSLSESINVVQLILKTGIDSGTLVEDASVIVQVGAPYHHSLPPQFALGSYHAEAIIRAAAARTGSSGYAALVIGAHGARLVVLPARTELEIVDAEADLGGRYEGDATLT